ncbi:hypothetical protein ETD86_03235 [Nonomuraea turkmeniaca]|uniref:Uncharacterized protein n=1 Tax=Nonomuraea turkmeniaca TaxID=103838 RepID=A0A5S4FVG8_9ACTN|nr:hypothetical protein [Nonomuraea turkmeniaca]TMR24765.1 hypothetical protein ETD86_03235 [Nonomuraea turkmeniaca]
MAAIADGGTSLHAEDPATAVQLIAAEVTGLLSKVVQAASITITPHARSPRCCCTADCPAPRS